LSLAPYDEARPYFVRWMLIVNAFFAALSVALYWLALLLFPELALKTLN
jgi:hypothetical protein